MLPSTKIEISTGTILKIVGVALALWFVYLIKEVVAIVFVAIILASAIDPFVEWCSRRFIPRLLTVVIVYIFMLTFVGLVVVLLIPPATHQVQQLAVNAPIYWERLSLDITALQGTAYRLPDEFQAALVQWREAATPSSRGLVSVAANVFGGVTSFILVMVIMFYLLIEEHAIKRTLRYLAPAHYQPYLTRLLLKIRDKIGLWLRGQLVLSAIVGGTVFIVMTLFGWFVNPLFGQYALALALVAFLFEFIPYVGPVVAAIPALVLGLSHSLPAAM
ncbi:MAG: AI-2E family transporter, partial [Patescibacteria group bacterium]